MSAIDFFLVKTAGNMSDLKTDSATVSYDKGFDPVRNVGGVQVYCERSGGVPLGYPTVTFGMRPPTKNSPVYKCSLKYIQPVLETVDPATGIFGPKLGYSNQFHGDFLMHERATDAEKLVFLNTIRSMLFDTLTESDGGGTFSTRSPLPRAIRYCEGVW